MKTRQGFVSNSSSSSFVVLVCEMTEEQKATFREKLETVDWDEVSYEYGQPTFSTNGKVFGGECDYDAYNATYQILKDMNLTNLMEGLK